MCILEVNDTYIHSGLGRWCMFVVVSLGLAGARGLSVGTVGTP
jgi:hypothetical protein